MAKGKQKIIQSSAPDGKPSAAIGHKYDVVPIGTLTPHPSNPRKHPQELIRAIARSIEAFGVNTPILIDKDNQIVAGHGQFEALKLLNHTEVSVIRLDHLGPAQARAYMLADNKLADRSSWDDATLAVHLKELSEMALEFDIEATGFEPPEIDFRIQALDDAEAAEKADEFKFVTGPAVTAPGDLWILNRHRLYCGSALKESSYDTLLEGGKAAAAFTDPPYNVRIDDVSGNGEKTHWEFPMASGEMTEAEFTSFPSASLTHICAYTAPGALVFTCMDWRHVTEMLTAGKVAACPLLNLCVWVKTNGGLGSLYRSRHELVFVFKNGTDSHVNNVQLGRFGRNRTNVLELRRS